MVTDVNVTGNNGDKGSIILRGGSPTILLDRDPSLAAYVDSTLSIIAKEILGKNNIDIEVEDNITYKANIPYAARYKESSYAFLARIMTIYGEWFYYNGKKLIMGNNPLPEESRTLVYSEELTNIQITSGIRNLNTYLYDYNPTRNEYVESVHPQDSGENFYMMAAKKISTPLYPNSTILPTLGATYDSQMERVMSDCYTRDYAQTSDFIGKSNSCAVRIGELVTTILSESEKGWLRDLGCFRVIEIHHKVYKEGHYENEFKGITGRLKALPIDNVVFPTAFPEPATVVANDDPQKQGRVKVRFFWQDENDIHDTTGWIRVQMPDAGSSDNDKANRGFVFIPEAGDQVMVGFQQGMPDRPFVMGSLFHYGNGKGGGENNGTKSIITKSGIRIMLNDNETSVYIEEPSGNSISMDGKGNIIINAAESITLNTKNMTLNASEDFAINGRNVTEQAENIITQAKTKLSVEVNEVNAVVNKFGMTATGNISYVSNAKVEVKGSTIDLAQGSGAQSPKSPEFVNELEPSEKVSEEENLVPESDEEREGANPEIISIKLLDDDGNETDLLGRATNVEVATSGMAKEDIDLIIKDKETKEEVFIGTFYIPTNDYTIKTKVRNQEEYVID